MTGAVERPEEGLLRDTVHEQPPALRMLERGEKIYNSTG